MKGTYADITDAACDVVIIGAGVIGCAAAYNLAKKGRSVTVLDREPNVGEGASSRNGGGVRQSGRDARELPLAMYAVENIWPTAPMSSTSSAVICAWARPRNTCRRSVNWRVCRRAWGST